MIYLDNAATTRPYREVLEEYVRHSQEDFANSNSKHYFGFATHSLLEKARKSVLTDLGVADTHQALFCSGATEANNTVFQGIAFRYANRGKRILVGSTEHPSVLVTAHSLARLQGFEVVEIPVNAKGQVEPDTLASMMDKQTILVSIMAVNNETGAINDLPALAQVVHQFPKAFFHSDLTQSVGKMEMDYSGVDFLSFSGHKISAPKGTGALIYRSKIGFESLHRGGDQEFGLRAGTVDVPGALALADALHRTCQEREAYTALAKSLFQQLKEGLSQIEEVVLNSDENGSPFVLNFSLRKHKASVVVEALSERGIYVSSVSACNSKGEPTSYVLAAMGKDPGDCANSIRVSFGHENTKEDVDAFLTALKEILTEVAPR